jgi:hypothetical protein
VHLLGDQEVLTALLGSKQYSHIPIHYACRGEDIVQYVGAGGFLPRERLRSTWSGLPPLIHAIGRKPWWFDHTPSMRDGWREVYDALSGELCPYIGVAQRYRDQLDGPTRWLDRRSGPGRVFNGLSAGHPALRGLPLAAVDGGLRWTQYLLGFHRFTIQPPRHKEKHEATQREPGYAE